MRCWGARGPRSPQEPAGRPPRHGRGYLAKRAPSPTGGGLPALCRSKEPAGAGAQSPVGRAEEPLSAGKRLRPARRHGAGDSLKRRTEHAPTRRGSAPSPPPAALRPAPRAPDVPRQLSVFAHFALAVRVGSLPAPLGRRVCYVVLGRMNKVCEMKYKLVDSPLGKIEVSGCELGLHGLKLLGQKTPRADTHPEELGGPGNVPEPLTQCASWLEAYFHEPAGIDVRPLPAFHHPTFQKDSFTRRVLWKLLKVVKFGETVSYQQLAALAGNPRAARAVGGAMRSNPLPIIVPCHRVICSSGAEGNYSGGAAVKGWLLAHEGRRADVKPGAGPPARGRN
ncbi:methylated-DNA--protein-cysteine methyltransferase [Choloepus didactylus]|uniref:methylated-DNA--protein-cysteine methyltransferase n=1 Tax=Choloepus didactylus TaxID=27675 RepID=UPI0018A00D93|nr:methylated-DNA--protein-cysteine methyltransferase [Choloepus didactylus]